MLFIAMMAIVTVLGSWLTWCCGKLGLQYQPAIKLLWSKR